MAALLFVSSRVFTGYGINIKRKLNSPEYIHSKAMQLFVMLTENNISGE
jgi:hypothetical protein